MTPAASWSASERRQTMAPQYVRERLRDKDCLKDSRSYDERPDPLHKTEAGPIPSPSLLLPSFQLLDADTRYRRPWHALSPTESQGLLVPRPRRKFSSHKPPKP